MNQETKTKLEIAVNFLKEGKSFKVNNLLFENGDIGNILIIGWTKNINIKNITKREALEELNDVKIQFNQFLDESLELLNFIKYKKIEFHLYFDDYGRASVAICSEIEGIVNWKLS